MAYPIAPNPVNAELVTLPVTLEAAQKAILHEFWQASQTQHPDLVLELFRKLFFTDRTDQKVAVLSMYLVNIVMDQHQDVFNRLLRSVCYILVNTWLRQRQLEPISQLFDCFNDASLPSGRASAVNRRLRLWLHSFQATPDFQSLKAYAFQNNGWAQRYQEYLLIDQYTDSRNPSEHQDSARQLAQHLKYTFQFQLAKYTFAAQEKGYADNSVHNPTILGDSVMALMKYILLRRDRHNYEALAARFCQQTSQMNYGQYKQELLRYLSCAMQASLVNSTFYTYLSEQLIPLESNRDSSLINERLAMKTVKHLIDRLTLDQPNIPSRLFILGACQGNPLGMVTLLLQLVLICPKTYSHLELRLVELIHCYESVGEDDCRWFIHFLEIFRIIFAMFIGHQRYSLVQANHQAKNKAQPLDLQNYRIFTQQYQAI